MENLLDARPDQLKILKLEHRGLRPMARTLLSSATKSEKIAAVALSAAILAAFADAPHSFSDKLGLTTNLDGHYEEMCGACRDLSLAVEGNVSDDGVFDAMHALFSAVDRAHAHWEKMAIDAGARLIDGSAAVSRIGGTGGKPPQVAWLNQLFKAAR